VLSILSARAVVAPYAAEMSRLDPGQATRTVRSCLRRAARAKPGDYVIALSAASASTPVIGRHIQPISGMAALGVCGKTYLPGVVSAMARARFGLGGGQRRRQLLAQTPAVLTEALQGIVSADDLAHPWPSHHQLAPLWKAAGQRRYVYRSSVPYGDHPSQLLDVWRQEDLPATLAPVLVFIPGGAWVFGSRALQGHALMAHLVRRGWVCLSLQYRTSPQHRWPRQMTDVKAAIAWARGNVDQFGGDPNFIVAAGCSAGGHLAALAGLTANDPQWQAELPTDADTSVDAVVSTYGIYDWQDRSTVQRARFMEFLERVVVKRSQVRHPEVFRAASPVDRVHKAAPPFLVVHGSRDGLIPVGEARAFVHKLRSVSAATVGYVELPGVGHGFDLIDAARTAPVVAAIGRFLHQVNQDRLTARAGAAI
jgi:acetyl esterase/lipase